MSYFTSPILKIEPNPSNEVKQIIYKNGIREEIDKNIALIKANETLIDYFYFVEEGRFRFLFKDENGNEQILGILSDGSIIGAHPLIIDVEKISMSVISEIPSTTYKIPKDTFNYLIDYNKAFRDFILKAFSINSVEQMNSMIALSLYPCKDRLYNLLITNIDKTQILEDVWYKLKVQYTQSDMGKIIGASRASVAKMIMELQNEGLIRIINSKIQVRK